MIRFAIFGVFAVTLASFAAVHAEESAATAVAPAPAAAQRVTVAASAPEARKQTCWREYRVGSSFPVTHCEDADDSNDPAARQRLKDAQENIQRTQTQVRAPGPV